VNLAIGILELDERGDSLLSKDTSEDRIGNTVLYARLETWGSGSSGWVGCGEVLLGAFL
jgi:hypothetical protein